MCWWIYISAGRDLKYVLTFSHFEPISKSQYLKEQCLSGYQSQAMGVGWETVSLNKKVWRVTWQYKLIINAGFNLTVFSANFHHLQSKSVSKVTFTFIRGFHPTDSRMAYAFEIKHICTIMIFLHSMWNNLVLFAQFLKTSGLYSWKQVSLHMFLMIGWYWLHGCDPKFQETHNASVTAEHKFFLKRRNVC